MNDISVGSVWIEPGAKDRRLTVLSADSLRVSFQYVGVENWPQNCTVKSFTERMVRAESGVV